MTDGSETSSSFLSPPPSRPITDDVVEQIGESDSPKIRGAMGFPGSSPGATKAFLLGMEAKTRVIVFELSTGQRYVYKSFGVGGMSHQEMVDHANELANEWLAQNLSDRVAAAETTEQNT